MLYMFIVIFLWNNLIIMIFIGALLHGGKL